MAATLVHSLRLDCAAMPGRHCLSKPFFSRRYIAQAEIRGQASIPRGHVPRHSVARFWISTAGQNASLTPNWISRFGLIRAIMPGKLAVITWTTDLGAH
jgi:hypothetical protein